MEERFKGRAIGDFGQGWLTVGCEAEDNDAEYSLHDAQREDESFEHFDSFVLKYLPECSE